MCSFQIEADLPTPPGSSRPDGILTTEIHKLVSLRRDVKRQMATLKSQLASERPNSAKFKQISDKYQQVIAISILFFIRCFQFSLSNN